MVEPGLGQLDLPAVGDLLAEHAVDIADAVAMRRDVDGRHAFHEAGGEPAEAAIAKRGVRLERRRSTSRSTPSDGSASRMLSDQAEIGEGIAHQPADQELQRR